MAGSHSTEVSDNMASRALVWRTADLTSEGLLLKSGASVKLHNYKQRLFGRHLDTKK